MHNLRFHIQKYFSIKQCSQSRFSYALSSVKIHYEF